MRSIDRRQLLVVVVALMCLTALPGASSAAGGGDVRMPSNHTDFGTGDEPAPEVLENFSVGGSGDSASLSGPVGGTTKGGGLVSSGDTISWSESSPATSESVINVTGVENTENGSTSFVASDGETHTTTVGGTTETDSAQVTLTGKTAVSTSEMWEYDFGSLDDEVAISHSDDRVFAAGENTEIVALNKSDGSAEWSQSNDQRTTTASYGAGVLIEVGSAEGLDAYDAKTGDLLWSEPGFSNSVSEYESGTFYVADTGGISALDPETGDQLWSNSLEVNDITAIDGTLYAITEGTSSNSERTLRSLDPSDGSENWASTVGMPNSFAGHNPDNGELFVYSSYADNNDEYPVKSVDKSSGGVTERFAFSDFPSRAGTFADGSLWIGGYSGTVREYDPDTGTVERTISHGDAVSDIDTDGALIVGGEAKVSRYGSNSVDPSVTVGGETVSHTGTLADGESVTESVTLPNGEVTFDTSVSGQVAVSGEWVEVSQTVDPVVELNGDSSQQISIDGSVADGQTVTKEIDNSWLESGENTATVTLNDSGLNADDPPMEAKVSVEKPAQSARYVSAAYDNLSRSNGVGVDWSGSGTLDVTVQGWTGSSWEDARSLSTSQTGDVILDYEPIDYEQTRVEIIANDNVEIREESIQFFTSTPELDEGSATPASGTVVSEAPVELRINVSDADFGAIQPEEVEVAFYDGQDNQLGTDTISANATATAEYPNPTGGANEWYVEATDSYGNTVTSETFTFNAPSEVEIRNEQTGGLITDADVTLEFYQQSSSPDNIEEIPVKDGTADMTGLPAGESFIAVADAEGYANRRIFVDSLIETQTIYLLNESADSVTVEYELEDFSGNYPQAETVMIVERNINGEWTPIQGDFFGATGKFEAQLLRDTRHRMRVVNLETGEERVAGTVTPQQSATETVTILPDGSITVDRGLEQIHAQPAIGSIPAAQGAEFGVDIQEGEQEITSWDIEIVLMNGTTETTLATRSGSGTGVGTFQLDLTGADGGTVMAVVDYQTPERSGTVRLSREVRENYAGAEGLLGGLITIGNGLGAGEDSGPSSASMMAALFVSLLVTGGVARVSTSADVMGISALVSVAGFAILGWVPMSLLFAATVGFGAMIALRRGI